MSKEFNNRSPVASQKIYERLPLAYPKSHREKYGLAMAQLFHDQCRDARNESQNWGVIKLWLRVLPDLVKTSFIERLAALNERKSMSDKLTTLIQPRTIFLKVFVVAFLIIFCTTVAVTFLLPESYASTARIKVENGYDPYFLQATFEIIQSQTVLDPVIDKLHLNTVWGKEYNGGEPLETTNTLAMLKSRISLTPERNTDLFNITVFSEDKNEAAQIANAITESYQDYRVKHRAELTAKGIDVLQQEYQKQEAQISQVQSDLALLRQKFNIPDDDSSSPAEFQQRYDKIRVEGEQAYAKQRLELAELRKLSKDRLRDVLPAVAPDSAFSQLLDHLSAAQLQYASLTNDYSPNNPVVVKAQTLNEMLNRQIDDRVAGILDGLESQVEAKRAALGSLTALVEKVKAAQPYWDKKRDLDQMIGIHKLLTSKIEAEKLDEQIPEFSTVEIIDRAMPGLDPVRPNKTLNIVFGVGFGILLALIVGGIAALTAILIRKPTRKIPATT